MSSKVCSLNVTPTSSLASLVEQAEASISKQVEMDAAGLVLWLVNEGVLSSPSCYEYDEEDEKYNNEYGDDEATVNDD